MPDAAALPSDAPRRNDDAAPRDAVVGPPAPPASPGPPASQAHDDEHLVHLFLHGKSPNTQEAYRRDIEQFVGFVDKPFSGVLLGDIQAWDARLAERYATSTRKRKLAAVKSLYSFAQKVGYIRYNVGAAVQTPKVRDRLGERILSEEEVIRILTLEDDLRNGVLLRVFYASGGRVSEVVGLCWRDVVDRPDCSPPCAQVTFFGKGDKTRTILLAATTSKRLLALREAEREAGYGRPGDAVFRSREGGSLTRFQMYNIVRRAAERAGFDPKEKAVSPHWFRHAHASHALDRGAPPHLVKETLGHESLQTTTKYTHARPGDSSSQYLNA